jgi:predicted PurR-regulated permease PerM
VTLAALIVSEVLLGIIGLILAIPLLLYVRSELESVPGLATPGDAIRTPREESAR